MKKKHHVPTNFITKLISVYVRLRFGKIDPMIRYFYRDTYYCKLIQLKYVFRDYVFKKKYKVVSFSGEFAPEFLFVIPFAYWHYKNGTLLRTEGAKYTNEMYFFSPDHREVYEVRTNEGNYNYETPRILYSHDYDMSKWERVPYKAQFKNDVYVYDKPILIVANRYNTEWEGPPISFFSIPMLQYIFETLGKHYQIIYNRPRANQIVSDTSDVIDLNEYDWIRENFPEVLLVEDLYKENRIGANNFNHFQMCIYANADHFLSIHGGTSALACLFEGENIIYSAKGPEHHFGCFNSVYEAMAGTKVYLAKTEEQVKNYIAQHYLPKT
ncbi:hypothetical protein [Pelobium manganitolerans]|uniref:hypothetical protein n=1 Tax=Pelobium manganitolerans TaxID=1842495 RepID=UPI003FA3A7D1